MMVPPDKKEARRFPKETSRRISVFILGFNTQVQPGREWLGILE